MTTEYAIQGAAVLKAVSTYLADRGAQPYMCSLPFGKENTSEEFKTLGLKCLSTHSDDGICILAISETEWWHVKCIGYADGSVETQINDFNEAISSAVSFYGREKNRLPCKFQNAKQYIGISMPETPMYMEELKKRIGKPLRQKLNLWVLLYDSCSGAIKSITPDSDY